MLCFATLFFVLFFAIIISEIAYNRARDESFLRLRWLHLVPNFFFFVLLDYLVGCINEEDGVQEKKLVQQSLQF